MPVVALWVDIEIAKSCGDEGVYYGEGIGDDVKNYGVDQQIDLCTEDDLLTEIISVSWGRSQHDHHRDDPVLEQSGEWGVERLVAGPESTPGQNTLPSELLYDPTLAEDHRHDVTECGQRHENTQGPFRLLSHNVSEETGSENPSRVDDVVFGNSGEVGDVGEHVEDGNTTQCEWSSDLECSYWILRLG